MYISITLQSTRIRDHIVIYGEYNLYNCTSCKVRGEQNRVNTITIEVWLLVVFRYLVLLYQQGLSLGGTDGIARWVYDH